MVNVAVTDVCHLSEVTKCLLVMESINFVLVAIDCRDFRESDNVRF